MVALLPQSTYPSFSRLIWVTFYVSHLLIGVTLHAHAVEGCGRPTLRQYAMVGHYRSPAGGFHIARAIVDVWKMML